MILFLAVNGIFVAVFVALAFLHPPWWGWVVFVGIWILADYFFAKGVHLKLWHWGLLIAVLTAIDVGVLYGTGQL